MVLIKNTFYRFMAQIASPVYWTRRLLSLSQQRSQGKSREVKKNTINEREVQIMAMYDWDGNGNKNDFTDNFIEYQIYQDCKNNNSTPKSSSGSSAGGFWIVFIIAAIVSVFSEGLGVLILLGYGFLKLVGM